MKNYILDENNVPVIEPDLTTWFNWLATADKTVKKDNVGNAHVSTVFLGIDYSFGMGQPLLFETMVFGGDEDQFQFRYSTREKAIIGHDLAVKELQKKQKNISPEEEVILELKLICGRLLL